MFHPEFVDMPRANCPVRIGALGHESLLPAAVEFGIDPLHLGIVMILNFVLGLLTPPVGLVLYVLSSVTGSSVQTVTRGTVPFLIPLLITLLIITFVPAFSLWLPGLIAK